MRIALVTTTINVPRALAFAAVGASNLDVFVACDEKTPPESYDFMRTLKQKLEAIGIGLNYYSPKYQRALGYKCSELIGWNNIQRRSIALLEAMKSKPRTIISWDDDNLVLAPRDYTKTFDDILQRKFSGLCADSAQPWFDHGQLLVPPVPQRGFPIDAKADPAFSFAQGAKIGAVAGACLGDPDISAVDRISRAPNVVQASELLRAGVAVGRPTWTIFNSQNSAIDAEMAPAWFMWPYVGRYDDIYASLVVQQMLHWKGWYTHVGEPFAYQQRNQHNLVRDLRAEIDGMERVRSLAEWFGRLDLQGDTVLERVRDLWECMRESALDPRTVKAAFAFLDDCETVM